MHTGTPHATVTGQRQSLIRRRDQFWAIVALLVFVLIALVIIDGRVTSLVDRLRGINQDLGYLRPILNLFGLGIVLALGWVVWRRILELPFPEFLKDKRALGVAKYTLVVSALVIAGIEAGTRWLPTAVKQEAATFSLPLSLLILALLIQTLQKVLAGHAGEGEVKKGESSGDLKTTLLVFTVLATALLCGWLLLKVQGVIWAQGASYRMGLAAEAERRVRQVLGEQVAHTWHGLRDTVEYRLTLSTNLDTQVPRSPNQSIRIDPPDHPVEIWINGSYRWQRTPGVLAQIPGDCRFFQFKLTNSAPPSIGVAIGHGCTEL